MPFTRGKFSSTPLIFGNPNITGPISLKVVGSAIGYNVQFPGDTIIKVKVADNPLYCIDDFIDDMRKHIGSYHNSSNLVVGLRFQPAGIIQLSFHHRMLIMLTPIDQPLTPVLKYFLESNDRDYTFVGVNVNSMEESLLNYYGVRLRNIIDLGHLSSIRFENNSLCGAGLKILAKTVLGKDINEPITINVVRTSSEGVWLNEEEIKHLCEESYVLHEISNCLGFV